MRFLASGFLHEWTQKGPLIHALNVFRIRFRIRKDIQKIMCISAVGDSAKLASALSETALSQLQRRQRQRYDDIRAVGVSAKSYL
jgi:hypothetical protein